MKEMSFTEIEQKIYDEIVSNINQQKKQTVAQIASVVNVAPSHVIKVAKKLGYTGLNDMWYSLSSIYTDSFSVSLDDFNLMENHQLDVHVQILCDMLMNYKDTNIMVNTIGNSDYVGTYLLDKMWQRGFHAMPYNKNLMEAQSTLMKAGMIIAINESGVVLLEQCLEARKQEYNIVSITSNRNSPLASNSHLTIELRNKKSNVYCYSPNFFTAYVIILIELLFARYDEFIMADEMK